jgi:hypothetical protein
MNSWMKKRASYLPVNRRSFLKLMLSVGAGAMARMFRKQTAFVADARDVNGVRAADYVIQDFGLQPALRQGLAATDNGLTLGNVSSGSFTSPVLDAPVPFNAIVPQWIAEIPTGTAMTINLRTTADQGPWSDWFHIHRSDDWTLPEDPDVVGTMVAVPEIDVTHTRFQFLVQMEGPGTVKPVLRELRFTCIDTTEGPTSQELLAQQQTMGIFSSSQGGYPKPPVVGRPLWCTDSACNYSYGLAYEPVTHLIVHHTVTSNSSSDWAAIVRAIWYFHTVTRGWGDIGYNYLVDMNGTLYEGHLGGDDVVGTHAGDANAGSMALAFIGTFTDSSIQPPPAMLDAASELFSWKADEKGIDVYSASRLPNMSWGSPHLMGHRDVYGTTSCPGGQAFALLPWLRDEVVRRISFTSNYIYVDELSGAFTKSTANWYTGPFGCGFNGHSYYTWSVTDPALSTNWGEWQLPILEDGWYEISVYAPYGNTGRGDTHGARYKVTHANGVDYVTVDQGANLGIWVTLGDFYFLASGGGTLFLSDLTGTDDNLGLWFDAIRLLPQVALPAVSVSSQQPVAGFWSSQTTVDFSWSLNNPAVIAEMTFEVATDAAFANVLLGQSLATDATDFSHSFGQDYAELHWRLVIKTIQNNFIVTTPLRFGVDTTPPVSLASQVLYNPLTADYVVLFNGTDNASGIVSYEADYQGDGASSWTNLASDIVQSGITFTPPDPSKTYWFRVRATDAAGNQESQHQTADISTAGATLLDNHHFLPGISR